MSNTNRRDFLKTAGLGGLGAAIAWPALAANPSLKSSRPIRLAIKGVTYTGIWYNGPALSIPQIIDRARQFGYDGVEIDAKRPQALPMDVSRQARDEIRRKLGETGVQLAAIASYNNFIEPIREYAEMNQMLVREQIALARDLGAKTLRVFASWAMIASGPDGFGSMEKTKKWYGERIAHLSRQQRLDLAVAALKELAPRAEDAGVTLAVQNHPPGVESHQDVLAILDAVNSTAVKACIDLQNLQKGENVHQAVLDAGARQAHVHFGGEFRRNAAGRLECFVMDADFPTYAKALLEIGYKGYLSFEFCHRCTQKDIHGREISPELAGIERVDQQVQVARDFMEQVMTEAQRQLLAKA